MEEFFNDIIPFSTVFMSALGLFAASFSSLFSVVNPFAAMPIYISLMEGHSDAEKIRTARKAGTYMFFVLIIFLLIGTYILSFFGISLPGIQIAGGLVIVRAGFSMLSPQNGGRKLTKKDQEAAKEKEDVSFSPLAMPLLSGPGSIAVVIGFGSEAQGVTDYIVSGAAVFVTALLAYLILRVSPKLVKYIGSAGMSVITRMMGFIVLAIGVQFIINGISKFYGIG
ncbi:MarC family NAAT transporter [Gracilimonas sp.]|uniref:MarC family NAAT transporter n=1 Tax=Gracilimonas sp. TaxID=1974203 RepID=UPI0028716387|nr:MarC family NAAT transporter [Gracilimonas sp.]